MVDNVDVLSSQYIEFELGLMDLSTFNPYLLDNFLNLQLDFLLLQHGFLLLVLNLSSQLPRFHLHLHAGIAIVSDWENVLRKVGLRRRIYHSSTIQIQSSSGSILQQIVNLLQTIGGYPIILKPDELEAGIECDSRINNLCTDFSDLIPT